MRSYIVVLSLLILSCNPRENGNASLKSLESRVDSLFNAEMEANGPGAAVLVSHKSEILIAKGYGLRDLATKAPITSTTNMRMASVSKQFTALAVLSLVEKGLLALDDPVKKYLPYSTFDDMTIEHLINHTSGIADYEEAFMSDWDTTQIAQNKDVLEWYAEGPPQLFQPGERWEYSNGAYNLLATIVAKVSGEEFSQYARDNVFEKSGMSRTNYFNLADPIEIDERAYCYEKNNLGQWEQVDGHFLNGCLGEGAVYTNLMDFYNYDVALRNQNLLSDSMHDLIFKPSSMKINDRNQYYAMGWIVDDNYIFHGGGWYGTSTFVLRAKNRPLTIAVFMNSDSEVEDLVRKTYEITDDYLKGI